ncbi:M16 family metallopeptidase [uncultured Weeksella sp.]|uniref:M16 family metallopeptidase n=1 Tax=uncultured Weeksella sp. TaxID=1161389 RepID=UPI00259B8BB2|nr:M16 family metallopeptidase [uncultured Weeksella sp.]
MINDTITPFQSVENDPTKTRIYTLENGLKVYLSRNENEPKIQTYIAVKTGSNNDPETTTGLAHYFEHMMFKGNSKIGALDWEQEKKYLDQLEELFEVHRNTKDLAAKKEIYQEIDRLSYEASKLVVPNEYDKFTSIIGASQVNAHTAYDETVYYNTIPKNELKKWLDLEFCRFSEIALRLFHTELETVYEEYNRSQDNDGRLIFNTLMKLQFPDSKYGTQTVLGNPEDLKNPSMRAIKEYFHQYYVANNMAIIMVGDLEYEPTIEAIKATFGQLPTRSVPQQYRAKEKPMTRNISQDVHSPSAERVQFSFRLNGANSTDIPYLKLLDVLLNNSIAGLMDLNINQQQKAQTVGSGNSIFRDYSLHLFAGSPKTGQSLEEVEKLILDEIENIKNGNFDQWLLQAVVNDYKKSRVKNWLKPSSLGSTLYRSFINDQAWENVVNELEVMQKITKEELMEFVKKNYQYRVTIYKREGENNTLNYVESPNITPIEINRKEESEFFSSFKKKKSKPIEPQFIDFDQMIKKDKIAHFPFYHIQNPHNEMVQVYYIFEAGQDHDSLLNFSLGMLSFAGTKNYSPEEFKKTCYKYGVDFNFQAGNERSILSINCLEENLEKALHLFDELLYHFTFDQERVEEYKSQLIKNRENAMQNRSKINNALYMWAKYGPNNRQRNMYKTNKIHTLEREDFEQCLHHFTACPKEIFVYGSNRNHVKRLLLQQIHPSVKQTPAKRIFSQDASNGTIYFVPYEMVQTDLNFVSRDDLFDPKKIAYAMMFNELIGSGLSSIVFQEIREAKSLAYSARAYYETGNTCQDYSYVTASIGTQPDKMVDAIKSMNTILNKMPNAKIQFQAAKTSIIKSISSKRYQQADIFFYWMSMKDKGISFDYRKEILSTIERMSIEDFDIFYQQHIVPKNQNLAIMGKREEVVPRLEELGLSVEEKSIEELFNF